MSAKLTITIPEWLDKICVWPVITYRRLKYGYSFRRINLGEGEWTILDQEDYYRFNHFKWSAVCHDKHIYAARIIRKMEYGRIKTMYLHREIMEAPKGLLVDHKNNNGLDNRRANLRLATHSQNGSNRPKKKNSSSQYMGVIYLKDRKRWSARLKKNGKHIFLGNFRNEIDAAKAYDSAARKYHGEFACLNFAEGY